MIAAPSKIGNFYLAKDGNSLVVSYARKAAMALLDNSNTNTVYLSIDSVMLSYDDNSRKVFKAVGSGSVANNTYALKPEFIHVEFGLLVPIEEQDFILTKTPNGIKVFGEKGAQYFDILNEKHQQKFKTSCGCLATP